MRLASGCLVLSSAAQGCVRAVVTYGVCPCVSSRGSHVHVGTGTQWTQLPSGRKKPSHLMHTRLDELARGTEVRVGRTFKYSDLLTYGWRS